MSNQITMKNLITEAFNDKQLAFFEQGMNTLLADEDGRIKTIRTACSEAVKDKLKERLHKKYNSLIEELHEKYSDKSPDRKELEQIFIARFGLSKDNSKKLAKQFIFNLCAPTDNAFLNEAWFSEKPPRKSGTRKESDSKKWEFPSSRNNVRESQPQKQ